MSTLKRIIEALPAAGRGAHVQVELRIVRGTDKALLVAPAVGDADEAGLPAEWIPLSQVLGVSQADGGGSDVRRLVLPRWLYERVRAQLIKQARDRRQHTEVSNAGAESNG